MTPLIDVVVVMSMTRMVAELIDLIAERVEDRFLEEVGDREGIALDQVLAVLPGWMDPTRTNTFLNLLINPKRTAKIRYRS